MLKMPPPEPPKDTEQFLQELIDYYRASIDYHQRAAAQAVASLTHLEALLDMSRASLGRQSVTLDLISNSNAIAPPELPSMQQSEETVETVENVPSIPTLEELEELLTINRGKILHLDYIVRILCGKQSEEEQQEIARSVEQLLESGASEGKWSPVPDSPGCWTIDLAEFPDLTKEQPKGQSRKKLISRLPINERLDQFTSLTEAIRGCLEANAPKSMNVAEMLEWFYPEGIPSEKKQRAREAIKDVIIKKCGLPNCWKRVAIGRYALNPSHAKKRK
ncbi:MAG: hypothetical protein MUD14_24845 [Hydrococcus sp. Prado102]|jgi:hypothetical protein|nr:hypothetical protein [Hydrococcus sp. Prado102]